VKQRIRSVHGRNKRCEYILVGKQRKRQLGRDSIRWGHIKTYLKEEYVIELYSFDLFRI
jgi:hypothetical protein